MIPIPACSVTTAPVAGRLRRHAAPHTAVRRGDVVAWLETPTGAELELRATAGGRIGGGMLRPGQSVGAGDAVVWLSRGVA